MTSSQELGQQTTDSKNHFIRPQMDNVDIESIQRQDDVSVINDDNEHG